MKIILVGIGQLIGFALGLALFVQDRADGSWEPLSVILGASFGVWAVGAATTAVARSWWSYGGSLLGAALSWLLVTRINFGGFFGEIGLVVAFLGTLLGYALGTLRQPTESKLR